MRFYQSLVGPLKIHKVGDAYVIGIKYVSVGGAVVHNCVHNDDYVFVVYPTLEEAKEAATALMELRKIPYTKRIEIG